MKPEEFLEAIHFKDYDGYVLEGEVLTVLRKSRIIQFNIKDGTVLHVHHLDVDGETVIGLYRIPEGYILHGELEIIMYDQDFNPKWSFAGRDIFISMTGKQAFTLLEDRIALYDFYDNYYEVDFNGKQLIDRPNMER